MFGLSRMLNFKTTLTFCFFSFLLYSVLVSNSNAQFYKTENGVFLKAAFPLDEPRHLCVDIPGHKQRVRVKGYMMVHSCKEGMWNLDERFEKSSINSNKLRMPHYDKCLAAEKAEEGSKIILRRCIGGDLTNWKMIEARLTLVDHQYLCLTIGSEPSRLTRGGKRLPTRAKARSLSMQACSDLSVERQLWTLADPLKITKPLLPPKGR
jgi:hypothetical protein